MGGLARDLKKAATDTTDVGFDLFMDQITSPATADVGVTRIDVGTSTTYTPMSSSNPLYAQLTAGIAEIGNVKNSGAFAVQIDGDTASTSNTISTNNSTTSTLAGGATWTGTGEDVSAYTSITITIKASHDSAAESMSFQFSSDNTNWDDSYDFNYVASLGARRFQFPVTAQYFRVVYVNGATPQTAFRVQTILHRNNVLTSIHRLDGDMDPDSSAQAVKSVLYAQASGTGDFTAVDTTAAGNLRVSVSEASDGLDIGAGNAGAETIRVSVATDDVNLAAIKTAVEGTLTVGSHAVTNAGTFATQVNGDALTALQVIDNSVFVDDAAFTLTSSSVNVGGAIRDNTLTKLAAAEADAVPLRVSGTGALWVATDDQDGTRDVFGRAVTASPHNTIDVQFFRGDPDALVDVTTANSATATASVGGALFSSSTDANGSVQGVSKQTTIYRSGAEVYAVFTAAFPVAGIANSYMRIGLYDANNGFFIGYEGTTFGATVRNNAVDAAQITSFSDDALDGSANSRFTRNGSPEAIDYSKLNVFRLRFGWLGSAPALFEVLAPDGHWVTFHKILYPNLQATPSIRDADLPVTLDITKTGAAATSLSIQTDCWGAGTTSAEIAQADIYAFQTTETLTNGSTFDSGLLALSPVYSQVHTTVSASHDGTITILWYSNAAGTDLVRTLPIPYTAANGFQMFSAPAFTPFNKYQFLNNSGSNQTDFYFDTKFLTRSISPQILRVDGPVVGGMVASVSRSLISAYDGSNYVNVGATGGGNLKVSLQEASDGLDIGAGNAGGETIRVSVATDDVNLSAIKTSVETIDNTIYVDDADWTALTSSHQLMGGVYQASPGSITDGDTGPFRVTANGALHVSDAGGAITVDWNGTTPPIGAGTEAAALRVTLATDSTGVVSIDDNGGSLTIDGTVTANLGATDNAVLDDIAAKTSDPTKYTHDAAGGTAVGLMAMAQRDDEVGSTATTTTDGDAQVLTANKFGQLKTTQLADATSEIKYAKIDAASSGDNTIQAAAGAGVKIRVLSLFLVSAGTVNVRFESGAAGTALTGQMNLVANTGFVLPFNPGGWFETADNTLLNLELSAAISVDGCVTYVEV